MTNILVAERFASSSCEHYECVIFLFKDDFDGFKLSLKECSMTKFLIQDINVALVIVRDFKWSFVVVINLFFDNFCILIFNLFIRLLLT